MEMNDRTHFFFNPFLLDKVIILFRPKIILFNIIFVTVLRDFYHVFRLQKAFCYIALPICNDNFD